MTEFVDLYWKRNRGYPWPEDSWGLTPMFGDDGWCKSCGVPKHEQTGSMILQSKGKDFKGAWVPYWQYDAVCLDDETAGKVAAQFEVKLLEVQWRGKDAGRACQIVVPSIGSNWFDVKELDVRVKSVHGQSGAACAECQTWRWLPLDFSEAPPVVADPKSWAPYDVVASPEWFGDGWQAFRQILYKRELAELIASASPRDFRVGTVEVSTR